jgi:hypothetical protein
MDEQYPIDSLVGDWPWMKTICHGFSVSNERTKEVKFERMLK